jgi:hypothetical protein
MSATITNGLTKTGIDIENGKIQMQADHFALLNNAGERTLDVDSEGNVGVGSVKTYNSSGKLATSLNADNDGALCTYYPSGALMVRYGAMIYNGMMTVVQYFAEDGTLLKALTASSNDATIEWEVFNMLYSADGYPRNHVNAYQSTDMTTVYRFNEKWYVTRGNDYDSNLLTGYFWAARVAEDGEIEKGDPVNVRRKVAYIEKGVVKAFVWVSMGVADYADFNNPESDVNSTDITNDHMNDVSKVMFGALE